MASQREKYEMERGQSLIADIFNILKLETKIIDKWTFELDSLWQTPYNVVFTLKGRAHRDIGLLPNILTVLGKFELKIDNYMALKFEWHVSFYEIERYLETVK